ncbi:hypothetical protein FG877_09985, partial [Enterococcus casseliflavus]|nr:hypothetical protein [Enterococcus casseliflavus]
MKKITALSLISIAIFGFTINTVSVSATEQLDRRPPLQKELSPIELSHIYEGSRNITGTVSTDIVNVYYTLNGRRVATQRINNGRFSFNTTILRKDDVIVVHGTNSAGREVATTQVVVAAPDIDTLLEVTPIYEGARNITGAVPEDIVNVYYTLNGRRVATQRINNGRFSFNTTILRKDDVIVVHGT